MKGGGPMRFPGLITILYHFCKAFQIPPPIKNKEDNPEKGWVILDMDRIAHLQFRMQVPGIDVVQVLDDLLKQDKCAYPIATILQFREKVGMLNREQYSIGQNWERDNPCENSPFPEGEDLSQGDHRETLGEDIVALMDSDKTSTDEEAVKKAFRVKERRSARPRKPKQVQSSLSGFDFQRNTAVVQEKGEKRGKKTPARVLKKKLPAGEKFSGYNQPLKITGQIQVQSRRKAEKKTPDIDPSSQVPEGNALLISAMGKRKAKPGPIKRNAKKLKASPEIPTPAMQQDIDSRIYAYTLDSEVVTHIEKDEEVMLDKSKYDTIGDGSAVASKAQDGTGVDKSH